MRRQGVSKDELFVALREAGVRELSEVRLAALEEARAVSSIQRRRK